MGLQHTTQQSEQGAVWFLPCACWTCSVATHVFMAKVLCICPACLFRPLLLLHTLCVDRSW